MKTFQDLFDVCVNHLLTQRVKSKGYAPRLERVTCLYRGNENRMCGIGPLISDEFYTTALEGCEATDTRVLRAIIDSGWGDALEMDGGDSCAYRLNYIQEIHDDMAPEEWEDALRMFAHKHNLQWNYGE